MILTLAIIIIFIFLVFGILFRKSKGKVGEDRVAHILCRLPKEEYRVINNLMLRTQSGSTTQIDHVVISQYGIFVIETKFYKGWIYGGENSEFWTQNIYGNKLESNQKSNRPIQRKANCARCCDRHLQQTD